MVAALEREGVVWDCECGLSRRRSRYFSSWDRRARAGAGSKSDWLASTDIEDTWDVVLWAEGRRGDRRCFGKVDFDLLVESRSGLIVARTKLRPSSDAQPRKIC